MTAPAVTTTWSSNDVLFASALNTNFTDLVNYLSNRNDGSATWDRVLITNASAVPLVVNNSTGSQNIANFQDNGSNMFQLQNGGNIVMNAAASFYLDGGGDTYIRETSANIFDITVGGTAYFRIAHATTINKFIAGHVSVEATKRLYLDGGSDTYLTETAANVVDFITGGSTRFRINNTGDIVQISVGDFSVETTEKIFLDGGTNTYVVESSGDVMDFYTGGVLALRINASQILDYQLATIANGAGGSATLSTVGGSGPATTTQNSWIKVKIAGTDSYIPIWR